MKREVNLVPAEIIEKDVLIKRLKVWLTGVSVLVVTLAVSVLLLQHKTRQVEASIGELTARSKGAQTIMSELERSRQEREILREKEKILATLILSRPWCNILSDVSDKTLRQNWFKTIRQDTRSYGSEKVEALIIGGHSISNHHLANFMSRLSGLPYFRGVNLKFTKKVEYEGYNVVEFEIECVLKAESEAV